MGVNNMRYFIILLVICVSSMSPLYGQSFNDALELFESEQYEEAATLFSLIENDDRSLLFQGKSHYALGNDLRAITLLKRAVESGSESIKKEAAFTLSLLWFRQRNYVQSLELLFELKEVADPTGIHEEARQLYSELLNFLTEKQRFQVFYQVTEDEIREDLFRNSIGRVDYDTISIMLAELESAVEASGREYAIQELRQAIGSRDSYSYNPEIRPEAPEGMIYSVGVALPSFESSASDFRIPRNIYFGITLAAEEYNASNPDTKVLLRFKDTYSSPDSASRIMKEFVWNEKVDALIGPLFSEPARPMSQFSELYELPMLAPLANSDDINRNSHNYAYQLNPTFSVHGRTMAQFAVNRLNLDTLAVITETGSLGESSAIAFRQEAERLGAVIAYYINEDFAEDGYDMTPFTEIFTPDTVLIDSLGYIPVDGVYAPFTGQAAETLTRLFMNSLEAMRATDITVMGSEEWRNITFPASQQSDFAIYYSEPSTSGQEQNSLSFFREDFRNRFGFEPDEFAMTGYDAATFLFQVLKQSGNPDWLKYELQNSPLFEGVHLAIQFNGTQINQAVSIGSPSEDDADL